MIVELFYAITIGCLVLILISLYLLFRILKVLNSYEAFIIQKELDRNIDETLGILPINEGVQFNPKDWNQSTWSSTATTPKKEGAIIMPTSEEEEARQDIINKNNEQGLDTPISQLRNHNDEQDN